MPTAAASFSPRRFAIMVMMINATWISPSCMATGTPMDRSLLISARLGLRSDLSSVILCFFLIDTSATVTLTAWESVVPSAAPVGPRCIAPMNR